MNTQSDMLEPYVKAVQEGIRNAMERSEKLTSLREELARKLVVRDVLDLVVKWREDLPPAFIRDLQALLARNNEAQAAQNADPQERLRGGK